MVIHLWECMVLTNYVNMMIVAQCTRQMLTPMFADWRRWGNIQNQKDPPAEGPIYECTFKRNFPGNQLDPCELGCRILQFVVTVTLMNKTWPWPLTSSMCQKTGPFLTIHANGRRENFFKVSSYFFIFIYFQVLVSKLLLLCQKTGPFQKDFLNVQTFHSVSVLKNLTLNIYSWHHALSWKWSRIFLIVNECLYLSLFRFIPAISCFANLPTIPPMWLGASWRPKLLAMCPRCSFFMWKMCFKFEG